MRGFCHLVGMVMFGFIGTVSVAQAADLKIVDAGGLIRLTRIVRESAHITVSILDSKGSGECVATNVDGIAAERREKVSPKGECVFAGLPAGTWQIVVSTAARWRVSAHE